MVVRYLLIFACVITLSGCESFEVIPGIQSQSSTFYIDQK